MHRSFAQSGLLKRPIAHRGLHRLPEAPENTLAAFRAAIEADFPIEIDVHLLADGKIAVIHDDDLRRLAGIDRRISDLTSTEARTVRILGSAETIPLLGEVLDLVAGQVPLLIEIKSHGREVGSLERAVVRGVDGYAGEFAIQSFNPLSVLWFRCRASHIWRGQLSQGKKGVPMRRRTRPDFVAYENGALPFAFSAAGDRGVIPLLAWTIRDPNRLDRALTLADNVIFDRSDELMTAFARRGVLTITTP